MALKMARPIRLNPGSPFYLKERTPADLLPKVRGIRLSLPIGEASVTVTVGEFVQTSLRTKDEREAKERHAKADGALRSFWEAHRQGPRSLTQKQVVALAGEFYRSLVAQHEDDPGGAEAWLQAEAYSLVARVSRLDPESGTFVEDKAAEWVQLAKLSRLFAGPMTALLSSKALVVDEASTGALLREIGRAFEQGARQLRSNAEGDYTPDPDAARFPKWQQPESRLNEAGLKSTHTGKAASLTIAALADLYLKAQQGRKAANTLKRYAPSLASFGTYMKNRDAAVASSDDVFAWAVHRRDVEGINAATVNKNDLVAASSMFKWAMGREGGRRIASNPVTKDTRLEEDRKVRSRGKDLRDDEVKAILKAALKVKLNAKNPIGSAAERWCPWLAAYSGARITELTSLRGSDIRVEDGVTVMDFRDTKTGVPRSVPIHAHVLEQGFLDYVGSRGVEPLFYDPARHGDDSKTPPAEVRSRKVAAWVRKETGLTMDVKANHSWRHTWATKATEANIEEVLRFAITGHSDTNVGRTYVNKSVRILGKAMAKFPRYEVE